MISRPRQHRNDAEAVAKKKNNPAEAMGTHIIITTSSSRSRSNVRSVAVGNVPSTHMSGHHKLKHRRERTHEHVQRHR